MKKLLSLSIAKKLWLLAATVAAGISLLAIVFLVSERSLILEERQTGVREAVESSYSILAYYHGLAVKGTLSEADAKRNAMDVIRALRYNGNEYFWINDLKPRMIMHPIKPAMDGTDVTDNTDGDGKRFFQDIVSVVKANGSGFVPYTWAKPGSDTPVPKVSFVKGFEPWGWVIGSGVYIDSVDTTFWNRLVKFSGVVIVFIGVLVGFFLLLARSITQPLNRAVKVAQTVAAGDLTSQIEVNSSDETGQLLQALKDMNGSLIRIVGDVRTSTETISTASGQIAVGNLDLSSRTEQQASSLEETAASMEELTGTVKQNADNARQANQLALSASDIAVRGGAVVAQVVDTMNSINASSSKIIEIISVIDGIAFQTNILALNAAVEAARAGEQGRGFAVVATEVRTLAQRSATAAKEIKTLIGDSVETVNAGARLVDQAGAAMDEIVDSVKRVTDIMGEITAASHEQTSGIEQINQAVAQMDQVTQQNAALVEEAAAAADALHGQADHLVEAVSVFKLDASDTPNAPQMASAYLQNEREPAQRADTLLRRALPARSLNRRLAVVPGHAADLAWGQF